jgi:hypothetical protein
VEGVWAASAPFINIKGLPSGCDGRLVRCSHWPSGNNDGLGHGSDVPPPTLRHVGAPLRHGRVCLLFYAILSSHMEDCPVACGTATRETGRDEESVRLGEGGDMSRSSCPYHTTPFSNFYLD